jgi:hypothetical protein
MSTDIPEQERVRALLRGKHVPSVMALAGETGAPAATIEMFIVGKAYITAELLDGLAKILARGPPPPRKANSVPNAWRSSNRQSIPAVSDTRSVMKLTARTLKCTAVLDASELAALSVPDTTRVTLQVTVAGGRVVTCDVASKSIRKCKAVISEHGASNVALIVQGKMGNGNEVLEAGLTAQVKTPKPAAAAAEATAGN